MADAPAQNQEPPRVVYVVIHFGGGEETKPGPAPASKASIDAMPVVKVKESGNDCCICLEEFKVDEEAKEMPCKHAFHSGCVEKWLRIHGSCPVCRFLMPSEEPESRSGDGDGDGDGGQRSLEGREIGLGFVQSVLTFASLANFMALASSGRGSEQSGSGQGDANRSSTEDTD